jgi:UDP-N-acetyl-D-mannosaminuronic acid transferase (WecB/TagA/CpsF family)
MQGGLVVAPSAPVLLGLEEDPVHRQAVRSSALAITDSGLMVFLWKLLTGEEITRVSGLAYLKLLLEQPELRIPGATFWVMPSIATMNRNLAWLQHHGLPVTEEDCYVAPQYGQNGAIISDPALIAAVNRKRAPQIIMAVGGGTQEKLGADLLRCVNYRPAVHCTGAAIGFLSGAQTRIPMWADQCRLGWLFRCLGEPAKFVPRYWEARKLFNLMLQYHGRLPGSDDFPEKPHSKSDHPAIGPLLGRTSGQMIGPL